jgi:hypothetical protein
VYAAVDALNHVFGGLWYRVDRPLRLYATGIGPHNEVHGGEYDYDEQDLCHGTILDGQTKPHGFRSLTMRGPLADYPTHAPRNAAAP